MIKGQVEKDIRNLIWWKCDVYIMKLKMHIFMI